MAGGRLITDEFNIRRAAQHLRVLMVELDNAKHIKQVPRGEPTTGGAGFGPRLPGNTEAMSLYCEIERELSIWLLDWNTNRHGVSDQLGWVAFNAEWVAQQVDSEGLLTELNRWAGLVEKAVGRGPTLKELAAQPERRQTARSICHRLHKWGYKVTPELLRKWAERKEITATKCENGQNLYLLSEVVHKCSLLTGTTVIIE